MAILKVFLHSKLILNVKSILWIARVLVMDSRYSFTKPKFSLCMNFVDIQKNMHMLRGRWEGKYKPQKRTVFQLIWPHFPAFLVLPPKGRREGEFFCSATSLMPCSFYRHLSVGQSWWGKIGPVLPFILPCEHAQARCIPCQAGWGQIKSILHSAQWAILDRCMPPFADLGQAIPLPHQTGQGKIWWGEQAKA